MRSTEEILKEIEETRQLLISLDEQGINSPLAREKLDELTREYHKAHYKETCDFEADLYKRYELTKDIPLDRLQETCNAEREDRVVVFDKPPTREKGTKFYYIYDANVWSILWSNIAYSMFGSRKIRNFYTTDESAKLALKELDK